LTFEQPDSIKSAVSAWADRLRQELKPGGILLVEWTDAATERQVVKVKPGKVITPVKSLGLYYGIADGHLVIFEHIFSDKWKDVTYIPLGMVTGIRVVEDGAKSSLSLFLEKTWEGHAHTRKVRISHKYAVSRTKEVERCLRNLGIIRKM